MARKVGGETRESHRGGNKNPWCYRLWKNSSEHQKDILETIKVKKSFILYYQTLIGQKETNSGQFLRPFQIMDARLEKEIEELQQEREALKQDYENGSKMISILETNIEELEKNAKDVRIDSLAKIQKVKRVISLKEKLKIIAQELSRDDISADQIKEIMKILKETKQEQEQNQKEN